MDWGRVGTQDKKEAEWVSRQDQATGDRGQQPHMRSIYFVANLKHFLKRLHYSNVEDRLGDSTGRKIGEEALRKSPREMRGASRRAAALGLERG